MSHITTDDGAKLRITKAFTKDVNDQEGSLPHWKQDYLQLETGNFEGEILSVSYPGLQIFGESNNKAVDQRCSAAPDSYCIGIPAEAVGEGYWCGHPLSINSLFFLTPNDELHFKTPAISNIYAVVIDKDKVDRLFPDHKSCFHSGTVVVPPFFANMMRSYLDLILQELLHSPETFNKSAVKDNITEGILNMLFMLTESDQINFNIKSKQKVHRYMVERTKDIVRKSYDTPVSVTSICEELNVSRRCLHNAFVNVTGLNPVTFIRNVRLCAVRRELLEDPEHKKYIKDIAAKWGFWHLGMFSKYYKELFSETPSETISKRQPQKIIKLEYAIK